MTQHALKGSMGVACRAQIQDGGNQCVALFRDSGSVLFDLSESSNKSFEPQLDGPATSEHLSALLPYNFPASGKYDAILDSFVTTTPTMQVRSAKALFDVITQKVYYDWRQRKTQIASWVLNLRGWMWPESAVNLKLWIYFLNIISTFTGANCVKRYQ